MSSTPKLATTTDSGLLAMTLPRLAEKKRLGEPIVMVTAYDYPTAQMVEQAGVDVVLVGDSGAEVVLGYPSTVVVSVEEMLMLTAAARRGVSAALLVADLPFGSYESSDEQAVLSAQRFVKEAGADAVKLEGGGAAQLARVRAIVGAGIPVIGHIGLTPQSSTALGGRRAQGRTAARALTLAGEARDLEAAGCFAIVFEAIPAAVASALTARLSDPDDRHRRRRRHRRPGARAARPARVLPRQRAALRQAVRRAAVADGERRRRVRRRCACAPLSGERAQLLDRP